MAARAADILGNCRLFAGLSPGALGCLASIAQVRRFARGQVIFRQAEPCPGLYVVGQGQVRVYKLAPSGKELVLHLVGAGGTFAEIAAIGRFDCPAFAEALAASTCALLPTEPLGRALDRDHRLCRELLASLTFWVRHLVGLLEDIVLRDAAGRLAHWLLEHADDTGRVSLPGLKRHLASHLNLTSETLSRTLRRLTETGLIEAADGRRLLLRDRAALQAAADGLFPSL